MDLNEGKIKNVQENKLGMKDFFQFIKRAQGRNISDRMQWLPGTSAVAAQDHLLELSSRSENDELLLDQKKLGDHVKNFIEEYFAAIEKGDEKFALETEMLFNLLFSSTSPNITDYLAFSDKFFLFSKFSRDNKLEYLTDPIARDINDIFSLDRFDFYQEEIQESFRSSPSEQIEMLAAFEGIFVFSGSEENFFWVRKNLVSMLETILIDYEVRPFVKAYAKAILSKLDLPLHEVVRSQEVKEGEIAKDISADFSATGRLQKIFQNGKEKNAIEVLHDPKNLPIFSDESAVVLESLLTVGYKKEIQKYIRETLGIDFTKLSLRSELAVLLFLSHASEEDISQVQKIFAMPGIDTQVASEVFVAIFQNSETLETILDMASQKNVGELNLLFASYRDLIHAIDSIEEEVARLFHGKNVDIRKIIEKLVRDTDAALVRALKENNAKHISERTQNLQIVRATFQALGESNEEVNFENFRGISFEKMEIKDLSPEMKKNYTDISMSNWLTFEDPEFGADVAEDFATKLESGEGELISLKQGNDIIAFVCFAPGPALPDGRLSLNATSLNIHPKYRGSKIGGAFIEQTLKKAAETHVLFGTVHPSLDVASQYINVVGFSITGTVEVFGKEIFTIVCDKERNESLRNIHESAAQIFSLDPCSGPQFLSSLKPYLHDGNEVISLSRDKKTGVRTFKIVTAIEEEEVFAEAG